MHRFYIDEHGIEDGVAHLPPEDARHALRVLRLEPGSLIELLHEGHRYQATLEDVQDEDVIVRVLDELPSTEPKLRVTLYQGLPKADKMEWIIQKAVELGVDRIIPVAMSRCVTKLDSRDAQKKQERWQKIAREASKQSGRCLLPSIGFPIDMKQLPDEAAEHDVMLVLWEDAHRISLRNIREEYPNAGRIGIVIGPEGGMSEEEVEKLQQAGCIPVTLGPRILRTETAGLCTLSVLMNLWGEME